MFINAVADKDQLVVNAALKLISAARALNNKNNNDNNGSKKTLPL